VQQAFIGRNFGDVQNLHRGSHADGQGTVGTAIQEIIRNMHSALLIDVSAEAVARISQTWRKQKCQTMAHLIDALVGARNQCAGSAGSHMSVVEVTMCMLTGLRPRTMQQVVSQLRRRAWEPKAPGGQGGRPAKSHIEVCVPAGVPWDDEINGVCVDAHCPNIESSAPNLGESSVAQNQGRSITDIGMRLGCLVACRYSSA
jgi:hypothetical protein